MTQFWYILLRLGPQEKTRKRVRAKIGWSPHANFAIWFRWVCCMQFLSYSESQMVETHNMGWMKTNVNKGMGGKKTLMTKQIDIGSLQVS